MSETDVLAEIIAHKRTEVEAAKTRLPLAAVKVMAEKAKPALDFHAALANGEGPRIIAECKQKSPSKGVMVQDYDPVRLARAYEAGGAAAISVLTDGRFFGGALDHLEKVKAAVTIPVLRKDFIIDAYQIYEARAAGADTFLLLSGVLTAAELETFLGVGRSLCMEPLIESHSAAELTQALTTSGKVFGINNRDLKTFSVNLETARGLAAQALAKQPTPVIVCESGIRTAADIERMAAVGYKAFLVGESLVMQPDPEALLADLIATPIGRDS